MGLDHGNSKISFKSVMSGLLQQSRNSAVLRQLTSKIFNPRDAKRYVVFECSIIMCSVQHSAYLQSNIGETAVKLTLQMTLNKWIGLCCNNLLISADEIWIIGIIGYHELYIVIPGLESRGSSIDILWARATRRPRRKLEAGGTF
jgi:hypothetical protein